MKFGSLAPALLLTLAAVACGGGGDDGVTPTDAAPDAPVDAAIDARVIDAAPVCTTPNMMCGAQCVNTNTSEEFCGDCNTACAGGMVCDTGDCACADDISIPPDPNFFMAMLQQQGGLSLGIGPMLGNTLDVLVIGKAQADTAINTPHTLSGTSPGTPPFAGFGYDVDIGTMTASAAYYATEGTLTFTKICVEGPGQQAGFSGTLTNVAFSAVDSLMNPVLVPGGCRIPLTGTFPTVAFSFGNVSCP